MASIQETAYPRLKSAVRRRDLDTVYTPTWDEIALANRSTRGAAPRVCFLILLKTFQRLGYFAPLAEVPAAITRHIARSVGAQLGPEDLRRYDASGTRRRHLLLIRAHLDVRPYDVGARHLLVAAMDAAARTKDDPADLVNVAIEELIHHRYELPAFGSLSRTARRVRGRVHRLFYRQIAERLTPAERDRLEALFIADLSLRQSPWQRLRADPGSPTLTHLAELVEHLDWVVAQQVGAAALTGVPAVKVKQFAAEARTLDAARMATLEPHKRYALTVALLAVQAARVRDDVAEMFVKRMQAIHRSAKEALDAYRLTHQRRTNGLVATLRDTIVAYQTEGGPDERLSALDRVLGDRAEAVLQDCEAHLAYAGNNYLPFLWRYYKSHRAALFRLLAILPLRSSSQDRALEEAIAFLRAHEGSRRDRLDTYTPNGHGDTREQGAGTASSSPYLDLSWVPDEWWPLVTGLRSRAEYPESVDRRHLEVCLFSAVWHELRSGDLYVEGSGLGHMTHEPCGKKFFLQRQG